MEQLRDVARNLNEKTLDNWGAAFNHAANFEFLQHTHMHAGDLSAALKAARRAGIKALLIAMVCEGLEVRWTSKI